MSTVHILKMLGLSAFHVSIWYKHLFYIALSTKIICEVSVQLLIMKYSYASYHLYFVLILALPFLSAKQ